MSLHIENVVVDPGGGASFSWQRFSALGVV
jgi:hypothetical protein